MPAFPGPRRPRPAPGVTGRRAAPGLSSHRDWSAAAPTPGHFLPLLYLAGLAAAAGRPAEVLVGGCAYRSVSMTAYTLDAPPLPPAQGGDTHPVAGPDAPADASNP